MRTGPIVLTEPAARLALTSEGVIFHSYYDFSPGVTLFQISDGLWDLTQLVTPVDDRCYFSGLH